MRRISTAAALAFALTACADLGPAGGGPQGPQQRALRVDDIEMHVEIRGRGEPVVLLHGGYGTHALWDGVAGALGERYRVIAVDARGRGRTADGHGPITAGRAARDLVGLLDALGIRSAHIVGHSSGSQAAIHAAIDFPERVRSITLTGCPFITLADPGPQARAMIAEDKAALRALRAGLAPQLPGLDSFAAGWKREAPRPERFGLVMEKLEAWDLQYAPSALASIRAPALVVKAGRDPYVPGEDSERLAAAITRSMLVEFPQATHALPRDDAAALARAIHRFIAARAAPGSKTD